MPGDLSEMGRKGALLVMPGQGSQHRLSTPTPTTAALLRAQDWRLWYEVQLMPVIEKEVKLVGFTGKHKLVGLFDSGATYSCIDRD